MSRLTPSHRSAHPRWLVLIYRAADHDSQQQILRRFAMTNRADITVLGTYNRTDCFVIAECSSVRDRETIHRLVTNVDAAACLLHATEGTDQPSRPRRGADRPEPVLS